MLEHDLFGKPVPTFPDHAQMRCTAPTCWRIAKLLKSSSIDRI
jgi:hypothetical protein